MFGIRVLYLNKKRIWLIFMGAISFVAGYFYSTTALVEGFWIPFWNILSIFLLTFASFCPLYYAVFLIKGKSEERYIARAIMNFYVVVTWGAYLGSLFRWGDVDLPLVMALAVSTIVHYLGLDCLYKFSYNE